MERSAALEGQQIFQGDFEKTQEILFLPASPAPFTSPQLLPRAEDWLRQRPASSKDHSLVLLQPRL